MELLLIRHGKAEERDNGLLDRRNDAERRLTTAGRKDMRKTAKGLRRLIRRIDVLATSPLTRARETAEIVAAVFGLPEVVQLPTLAPTGDMQAMRTWLRQQASTATAAVVGHEPYLSSLASLLLTGSEGAVLVLKKGACCLIELDPASNDAGSLRWLMQPGQLRKLAD